MLPERQYLEIKEIKAFCLLVKRHKIELLFVMSRDMWMGDAGGGERRASGFLMFSNLQENWSKVSHAARDLAEVVSVTFFSNSSWSIPQNAPLPKESVSVHHWS